MEHDRAANILAELGNTTRLAIFRYLVKAGPEGASVGQIQARLDIPGSTLSHHIARLVSVDLVQQERESRTLHCRPQLDTVRNVLAFLMAECCTGVEMTKDNAA